MIKYLTLFPLAIILVFALNQLMSPDKNKRRLLNACELGYSEATLAMLTQAQEDYDALRNNGQIEAANLVVSRFTNAAKVMTVQTRRCDVFE